jgi:hypothetical protein
LRQAFFGPIFLRLFCDRLWSEYWICGPTTSSTDAHVVPKVGILSSFTRPIGNVSLYRAFAVSGVRMA